MDTIEIRSAKCFDIDKLRQLLGGLWTVDSHKIGGLTIHGDGSRVYLYKDRNASGVIDSVILLDYSDVEMVKKVIAAIADDPDVVVNADFGVELPGDRFVDRIRSEPNWNWRS